MPRNVSLDRIPLLLAALLLITNGAIYHGGGQSDWLTFAVMSDSMTAAQLANETVASMSFIAAGAFFTLFVATKPLQAKDTKA